MTDQAYSAAQLLQIAGISRRQMNRWIELGALQASARLSTGKGVDHLFDFADLLQATALQSLCTVGCALNIAALAARHVAGIDLPDDLENDDAPEDFLLVFPAGDFALSDASDLVERLRAAPPATIVLRLRDVQRSVVAGAAEAAFRARPRRGRKPGQQAQRRVTADTYAKRPMQDVDRKKSGKKFAPARPPKARSKTQVHPAKKPISKGKSSKGAAQSKVLRGNRIDKPAARVEAPSRSPRASSTRADPIEARTSNRPWYTRREKPSSDRTSRPAKFIRERRQQRKRTQRRARGRRVRHVRVPARARTGSDDADPEPPRRSALFERPLPFGNNRSEEHRADASRPPFRGGRR